MKVLSNDFVFALSCMWWGWDQQAAYFDSTSYNTARPQSSI